MKLSNAIEKML